MLDFTRFEILTFDCYGTLINWEAGILSRPASRPRLPRKEVDDATLLKLYGDFEHASEQRPIPVPIARSWNQSSASSAQNSDSLQPTAEALRSPTRWPAWKPWPDTVAALRQLKSRFRLAILSNVDDDLFAAHSSSTRSRLRRGRHRAASPGLQAFAETLRTGPEPHPRSRAPRAARGSKHLSRRNSSSGSRPRNRLGTTVPPQVPASAPSKPPKASPI